MKTTQSLRYAMLLLLIGLSCQPPLEETRLSGVIFGTQYSIIYEGGINYQFSIDSLFATINQSMSTYQVDSDISKLNRGNDSLVDTHFEHVFKASKHIFKATQGAFDPSIGIVVNAWDFGPQKKTPHLNPAKIDSLMQFVDFDNVQLQDHTVTKPKGTFLDFNAIAKGYAVDVVSEFLERKKIYNYLVDIGGEIRCSGINSIKKKPWKVGIENPNFDGSQSINKIIALQDAAMATSGTYRKFKIDENGQRYAHIIDTATGYPSKTNVLSVSVIAPDCMTADAYATAFKTMGIDATKVFLKTHPELRVFFIFQTPQGSLGTTSLNGFL